MVESLHITAESLEKNLRIISLKDRIKLLEVKLNKEKREHMAIRKAVYGLEQKLKKVKNPAPKPVNVRKINHDLKMACEKWRKMANMFGDREQFVKRRITEIHGHSGYIKIMNHVDNPEKFNEANYKKAYNLK